MFQARLSRFVDLSTRCGVFVVSDVSGYNSFNTTEYRLLTPLALHSSLTDSSPTVRQLRCARLV